MSIITNTDAYKESHHLQLPPGTQYMSSYIESRGGEYPFQLFFGLQMVLDQLKCPTLQDVNEARYIVTEMGYEFNEDWGEIANLGYLPLFIEAVKEGTVLPTNNVLVQVNNTDPRFPWLTSFVETMLLRAVWYPTTVATRSKHIKNIILKNLERTGDPAGISFKLHDFGARGVSSEESAGIGGAAHLVNFLGTDTISGVINARKFYAAGKDAGFSIPASEHSTITSWGRDNEALAFRNMLDKFGGPGKMFACVSDSYDIYHAVEQIWGAELKEAVINSGSTVVVRPDSGDPTVVPVEVVKRLASRFGAEKNAKGFYVLPPYIRVIQGDGVNEKSIATILAKLEADGFSGDNIAFGMGGEMLQTMNRDTLKFAMKASAAMIDNKWIDVFKDPITDSVKKSKKGRLALVKNGSWKTLRKEESFYEQPMLEPVWKDGVVLRHQTMAEIRALSNL
jgi:nicotinamide phosphoribosyltransferase